MRRGVLIVPIVGLALLGGACGSDQSPAIDGAVASTSTTVAATGATDTTLSADPSATTAPAAAGGAGGGTDMTQPAAGSDDGGGGGGTSSPAFPPPEAGRYSFHTTGTQRQNTVALNCGTNSTIDRTDDTTVEHLSDTDTREAGPGQTSLMRYQADGVYLLSLDLTQPGLQRHFDANPPVLFAPVPPSAGQSWNWQLTDSTGKTTVAQASSVRGTETITVAGGAVDAIVIDTTITISGDVSGTVNLTSWVDPARRTAVKSHQHTEATVSGFCAVIDTTSELVGFTAA